MANGNLLTVIPLIAFDPVGPPVGLALYHNSSVAHLSCTSVVDPCLGPGWSFTNNAYITEVGDDIKITHGDGTVDLYDWNGSGFDSPTGVYDRLVEDTQNGGWVLYTTAYWSEHFDENGWLVEIRDSGGHALIIVRDSQNNGRITSVCSAVDTAQDPHRLTFSYDQDGLLESVTSPLGRQWTFGYDDSDRLDEIGLPFNTTSNDGPLVAQRSIEFTYNDDDRIETVTSPDGLVWTYGYSAAGSLSSVTDPGPSGDPYTQSFTFPGAVLNNRLTNTHTDRRGYTWTYKVDTSRVLREFVNPLSKTWSFTWDADRNLTLVVDPLTHYQSWTYGDSGNAESSTDGLGNSVDYTWEDPDQNWPNFYRLILVQDPLDNWVELDYQDANDPTLVTAITEIADGQGVNGPAVTTLTYYGASDPDGYLGQLESVTDANGVETLYEYDEWGYLYKTRADHVPTTLLDTYPPHIDHITEKDEEEKPIIWVGPDGEGVPTYGVDNNLYGVECRRAETIATPFRSLDVPSPWIGNNQLRLCLSSASYDLAGRPTSVNQCILAGPDATPFIDNYRESTMEYDDLGRPDAATLATNEPNGWDGVGNASELESSVLLYDADGRPLQVTGPDGNTVTCTYDAVGRLSTVSRPITGGRTMSASYTYDDASRLDIIYLGNGASIDYSYDNANRISTIINKNASESAVSFVGYTWNAANLITARTEWNSSSGMASTSFTYDNRGQLIQETRTGDRGYSFAYTYDQLGNRLVKENLTTEYYTEYIYDSDNYANGNPNRLVEYREYDDEDTLLRTVQYGYNANGATCNVVVKDEGDDWYRDLALYYDRNGRLWIALWDKWQVQSQGAASSFSNYTMLQAKEFRYDTGRQRYVARDLNIESGTDYDEWYPETDQWTIYSGNAPYYETGDAADDTYFLGALAEQRDDGSDTLRYKHGDVIGSTQWLTDHNGAVDNPATTLAYTAFGEAVGDDSGAFSRYRYAGGHGYESDLLTLEGASGTDPITLLHVGERWYQPGIGRFLQRDPMGIAGWINVYVYAGNCPTVGIDPGGGTPSWLAPPQTATKIVYCGLLDWVPSWSDLTSGNTIVHGVVAKHFWQRVYTNQELVNMSDAEMYVSATSMSVALVLAVPFGWAHPLWMAGILVGAETSRMFGAHYGWVDNSLRGFCYVGGVTALGRGIFGPGGPAGPPAPAKPIPTLTVPPYADTTLPWWIMGRINGSPNDGVESSLRFVPVTDDRLVGARVAA